MRDVRQILRGKNAARQIKSDEQKKAIFLDRDGTLNFDAGYAHKIEDWRWQPRVLDALTKFKNCGWALVVVSNQSGIGRGYYGWEQLKKLEEWLVEQLAPLVIDAWRYCPHLPEDNCLCRKPLPGLIIDAARELDIDPAASWMLGDRLSDVQAGIAAGCRTGLILNGRNDADAELAASLPEARIWRNLLEAADFICG